MITSILCLLVPVFHSYNGRLSQAGTSFILSYPLSLEHRRCSGKVFQMKLFVTGAMLDTKTIPVLVCIVLVTTQYLMSGTHNLEEETDRKIPFKSRMLRKCSSENLWWSSAWKQSSALGLTHHGISRAGIGGLWQRIGSETE